MCKESLAELGHTVDWRNPDADVEINFIQPEHWHWSGVDYRIAYLPWESTDLKEGWADKLNEVDEVWTPSPVIAEWFVDSGVTKPVKVYQHGVEALWEPRQRTSDTTFRVLHHGAEALRKGGNETIQAFMNTLWDEDAQLVLKMILQRFNIHDTKHIQVLKTKVDIEELVAIYHSADMFCYPSWGEGFGLTPLQAMATGMPVLVTDGWAPYEKFLPATSLIKSELVESPWQGHHPGKMFKPDDDDLRDKLRWHFDNRESEAKRAFELTAAIHEEYNWTRLTEQAFSHLI